MDNLQISRFLVVLASIAITFSLYLQVEKIWRTKSANDFSPVLLASLLFNEAMWLNYGLNLREWPICLISMANLPAVLAISFLYIKFRMKGKSDV